MPCSWWVMALIQERIIGWCAIPGAIGVRVVTSECSAMVRATSLVEQTNGRRMVMPVMATPTHALIAVNVASCRHLRTQLVCARQVLCEQCRLFSDAFLSPDPQWVEREE